MSFLPVCEPLLEGNELKYVTDAVRTGWISSSGSYVSAFEKEFAAYCGVRHGICTCNGTQALHLALTALGIGPGDEVIIPDFTMIASALAVCYTGAMPVFVDADPHTWNCELAAVAACITPRTRVIMAVHLFGNPCDMQALAVLARTHGLVLMEDAAQAHGAVFQGRKAGALGQVAAFSFFANKNLTTGEGGMVVTDDDAIAEACRYYKNLCFPVSGPRNYIHQHMGFNYRMSNLHAALGLAQVERAEHYRALRCQHGQWYREQLETIPGVCLQATQAGSVPVHWMNGLALSAAFGHERAALQEYLMQQGIETRLFFNGMHRQPVLQDYGCACDKPFPLSDFLADNGLYLPSSSTLCEQDIVRVCDSIRRFQRGDV